MSFLGNAGLGKLILVLAVFIFTYYFFWVFILPFMLIDEGNLLYSFFPHLKYAFILPSIFGVIFLGSTAMYTVYHVWVYSRQSVAN